jgi:hypothetical protein
MLGLYGLSYLYGAIDKAGGWKQQGLVPIKSEMMVGKMTAHWLERVSGYIGYAVLMTGTWFLFVSPINTGIGAIEMLALIAYGSRLRKGLHRLCGIITLGLVCFKFAYLDLHGQADVWRVIAAIGSIGVCSLSAWAIWVFMSNVATKHEEGQN